MFIRCNSCSQSHQSHGVPSPSEKPAARDVRLGCGDSNLYLNPQQYGSDAYLSAWLSPQTLIPWSASFSLSLAFRFYGYHAIRHSTTIGVWNRLALSEFRLWTSPSLSLCLSLSPPSPLSLSLLTRKTVWDAVTGILEKRKCLVKIEPKGRRYVTVLERNRKFM